MKRLARYIALLTFAASLTLIAGAQAATWEVKTIKAPEGASEALLFGISCSSANFCIAVGDYKSTGWGAAADTWNGTSWGPFPLDENPGFKGSNASLQSISCWAQEECAAAGTHEEEVGGKSVRKSLIEEYQSKFVAKLRQVPSPNPSNGKNPGYFGISCPEREACLATGNFVNTAGTEEKGAAFASEDTEGLEGKEGIWGALSPIENPGEQKNGILQGVSCIKTGECIAVGGWGVWEPAILQYVSQAGSESWNKSKKEWVAVAAPEPTGAKFAMFYGVSCKSATFCMAVGKWSEKVSSAPYQTFADTWNGSKWTNVLWKGGSEGATEGALHGISCISVEECEMVGKDESKTGEEEALIYRWKKGEWTYQKAVKPAGAGSWRLEGISCTAVEACNAVGVYGNGHVLQPFGEIY